MIKNLILVLLSLGLLFAGCSKTAETPVETAAVDNPFFAEYDTPFKVPPFHIIKPEHFIPAYEKGMEQEKAEIDALDVDAEPHVADSLEWARASPLTRAEEVGMYVYSEGA